MIPARARGPGGPDHQRLVLARRRGRRPAVAPAPEGVAVRARRRLAGRVRHGRAARRSGSCSCGATCRRARAGSSSTAARRRPSGSSTRSRPRSRGDTGQELEEPGDSIKVRQRRSIPFREIARTAFRVYPKRAVLGFSLFIGQAFLYNAVTFTLGLTLTTYLGVGGEQGRPLLRRVRRRQLPRARSSSGASSTPSGAGR